jgi:hypothetical protein
MWCKCSFFFILIFSCLLRSNKHNQIETIRIRKVYILVIINVGTCRFISFYYSIYLIKIMTNNRADYETIDDKTGPITESVYTNPVFDGHDQVNSLFLFMHIFIFIIFYRVQKNYYLMRNYHQIVLNNHLSKK